jgi:hypothetical protein
MFAVLNALGRFAAGLFKSRCRLEAKNLLLPHQLMSGLGSRADIPNQIADVG